MQTHSPLSAPSTHTDGSALEQAARIRVLMLARDLGSGGGVVAYVRMLMQELGDRVLWKHRVIGRRPGERRWQAPLRMLADNVRLLLDLRRDHFQLLQLNPSFIAKALPRDMALLAVAQWFGRVPQLVFIHGWDWRTYQRVAASPWQRRQVARLLGRAARVVVLSDEFARALQDLGVPAAKIHVTTTMFWRGDVPDEVALRERPAPPPLRLLFMARIVAEKGLQACIEAVALLRSQGHEVELLVAGDGPARDASEASVDDLSLQEQVRFIGYARGAAKRNALCSSHIFVLPSQHGEGCPVSMLEAMASGLPVIVTSVGGIPALVQPGIHGLLLPDATPKAIAESVAGLARDPALLAAMGRTNRQQAWSCYEAQPVAAALHGMYLQAIRA
jgi:glycosyltransferase involved in cell wall biosynthesis